MSTSSNVMTCANSGSGCGDLCRLGTHSAQGYGRGCCGHSQLRKWISCPTDSLGWPGEQLLMAGVSEVAGEIVAGLLKATGHWPMLLALVNGVVRTDVNTGRQAEESMREILRELHATGPTALDVNNSDERHTAVARTIEVSLRRLSMISGPGMRSWRCSGKMWRSPARCWFSIGRPLAAGRSLRLDSFVDIWPTWRCSATTGSTRMG